MKLLARNSFTIWLRHDVKICYKTFKFFSLLLDGSTDKGNIDNKAMLVA